MKIKLPIFTIILVGIFTVSMIGMPGCEKAAVPITDTINIGLGKVFRYNADLSIKFDSVLEDSRCPTGAECIWEGYAEAKFELYAGENTADFTLFTFTGFRHDTTLLGYKLDLVAVNPYPTIETQMNTGSYSARVFIQKIKNP